MKQRLDYREASPQSLKAMLSFQHEVDKCGLEHSLLELVKIRVSQINGCAWCLDMHTKDARSNGETEQRLYLISVWREAHCYSERERAALAWAECVTQIGSHEISDSIYSETRKCFDEKELVCLTMAVIAINAWNRLNVAFRTEINKA